MLHSVKSLIDGICHATHFPWNRVNSEVRELTLDNVTEFCQVVLKEGKHQRIKLNQIVIEELLQPRSGVSSPYLGGLVDVDLNFYYTHFPQGISFLEMPVRGSWQRKRLLKSKVLDLTFVATFGIAIEVPQQGAFDFGDGCDITRTRHGYHASTGCDLRR